MAELTLMLAGGALLLPAAGHAAQADQAAEPVAAAAEAAPVHIKYTVRIEAPSELEKLLQDNLDLLRYRDNPRTDREQLQRLVRDTPAQVKTLVATAGYYTPTVKTQINADGAASVVVVNVDPGPATLVGSVDIELQGFKVNGADDGANVFNPKDLKASWGLKEGQQFRQGDWESAKRDLLRQVVQTRYPRAQLNETQATVDPTTHRAALRVVLDSGPELRFGPLRIEGLKRYPATIITSVNQIKPGDYYSEAALQALQARIQDTGYFSSVNVGTDLSTVLGEQMAAGKATQQPAATDNSTAAADADAAKAKVAAAMTPLPLVVSVVENKQRTVSAGVGVSTNTGNRAQLNYDDLSVFGLKFKSALTVETKQQTANATFFFPTTPAGYNDSVGASFVRTDLNGEQTATSTAFGKRAWGSPLLEHNVTLEYDKENQTIDGYGSSASKAIALSYGITMRKLDNLLFPTKGYAVAGQVGAAVLPILTDQKFIRLYGKGIYYVPVSDRSTVILRAEAGAVDAKARTGIPSVFLFRTGGDGSVRGYAYQDLGLKVGTATIGGRYLADASAEYQYWVTPTWGAATFYDAGNAADTIKDLKPKSGYGVGVRYKSPVGPINVDVAYGHAVKQVRLHFSLGFTF